MRTCKGHKGYITYIAISPDNSLVASACTEGTIRIWQLATGRCLLRLAHGEGEITWLQFEHSSSALSSGGSNGKCIVWDLSRLLPEPDQVPLLQLAADRQREQAKEEAAASATAETGEDKGKDKGEEGEAEGAAMDTEGGQQASSSLSSTTPAVPAATMGMFSWSRTEAAHPEGPGKLVLPHIQDIREGHQGAGVEEGAMRRLRASLALTFHQQQACW